MITIKHDAARVMRRLREHAARQAEARLEIRQLRRRKRTWWRSATRLWPGFGAD